MTATETEPSERVWTLGRILAVTVALGLILFWLWIFAGGPRKQNPDYLSDRTWTERAEATCGAARSDIDALPGAETTARADDRADVVDQATDRLEAMVDELDATRPSGDGDVEVMAAWIADYRAYVANRRDYAARLRTDPTAKLLVDEKEGYRDGLDKVIETFADVNEIPSCAVPGDVG